MTTPTTSDPAPYVPIRRSGWPGRQIPIWVWLVAAAVVVGGVVLVSLSTKPSHAQQAADLNSYMHDMNASVESCAGGVTESQQALSQVQASGYTANVKTAITLVTYNAANCEPADNEQLADLTQYQVTESLASYNLTSCTSDYIAWAFDAEQVQDDQVAMLNADDAAARASVATKLANDTARLNAERGTIDGILHSAEHALSDSSPVPSLPG